MTQAQLNNSLNTEQRAGLICQRDHQTFLRNADESLKNRAFFKKKVHFKQARNMIKNKPGIASKHVAATRFSMSFDV